MEKIWETVLNWLTTTGVRIVIAVVILFISFKLINWLDKKFSRRMIENKKVDKTIAKTLVYAIRVALKVLIVICLIGYLGIETGALSAAVASLGVCVGLAVNGTLSNLAGGVMIMVTRPFKVDDYISAQGQEGTVEEIMITYTKLITPENKTVYLPNSALSTGTIINYSEKDTRRMELIFLVTGNDPGKVRRLLLDVCRKDERILKNPEPFARISEYGSGNGLKITLRAWCANSQYWDVYYDVIDQVKEAFDENEITLPNATMDIRSLSQDS